MLKDLITTEQSQIQLKEIQDRLFTIGSNLASDPNKDMQVPDIQAEDVFLLENAMDEMDKELSPLKHFILPGGHPTVSFCHIARCVCRRAERCVVPLVDLRVCDPNVLKYLNRLSDFFFVASRWCNLRQGTLEFEYRRPEKRDKQRVATAKNLTTSSTSTK